MKLSRKRIIGLLTTFIFWLIGVMMEDPVKNFLGSIQNLNMHINIYILLITILAILFIIGLIVYWRITDREKSLQRQINALKTESYGYAQHLMYLEQHPVFAEHLKNVRDKDYPFIDKNYLLGILHPSKDEIESIQKNLKTS